MNPFFLNDQVTEEQNQFLHRVLDLGIDFMKGDIRNGKALQYQDMDTLKQMFSSDIPTNPSSLDAIYSALTQIAAYSISQSTHTFLAFPDSAGSLATYCADIISSFLNQNLIAVDRSAPVATYIEAQLIAWLRYLIGYTENSINSANCLADVGGMWTTGGNMSNHIAILTAMLERFPEIVTCGLQQLPKRPVIVLSKEIAHYSFLAATRVLGIGSENVVWASTDQGYVSDVVSIQHCLDHLPDDCIPFMVVAVAGNCRTSSIDDLEAIAQICRERKIWFHVDACHGGSLLFSEELKKRIKGIELADSVTIDPHKGLFTTYSSSYVLFKNPSVMSKYCRYSGKAFNPDIFDLGLITPFYGSRGFESLKLWLLIKHMGIKKIGETVEHRNLIFDKLLNMLACTNYFLPLHEPTFYRSVYVFFPKKARRLAKDKNIAPDQLKKLIDKYTILFSNMLYERGRVIFDLFSLNDVDNAVGIGSSLSYKVIGVCCGHAEMSDNDFHCIEQEICLVADTVQQRMLEEINGGKSALEVKPAENGPASW